MTRPRILTWHVHGSYLYYLAHCDADIYVPVRPGRPEGYGGRPEGGFPWPDQLHEIEAEDVRSTQSDAVLYQSRRNWLRDRYELLSPEQQRLPAICLEHDPPREDPVSTRHFVDDPRVLLVHVTPFNNLMWDPGATPTKVIDHGVVDPGYLYTGEIPRGVAVVNNIAGRGRRLGADILERVRAEIPIDLVGMGSEAVGGLGEIPHAELPAFLGRYRFFFNPIRYTSMGLAVCEAMMLGMPIVGLATTEMVTAITNGEAGYLDTDVDALLPRMRGLLDERDDAARLGRGARAAALARFNIERFCRDWEDTFREVTAPRAAEAARSIG